jgi:hypothetical protein
MDGGARAGEPTPRAQDTRQDMHDEDAYRAGYDRTLRELRLGRAMGWSPTERQIVVALTRTLRIYASARRGKPVGGQHPDWLRGRADALRTLLRQGVGSLPEEA